MSFNLYNYYKEIKNRLFITVLAWTSCLTICYLYKETILFTLVDLNSSFSQPTAKIYFIFTDVTEVFTVYLELSLFVANQVVTGFLVYQTFMFFVSSLYEFEYLRLKFAFKVFISSWLISIFLLYTFIIPFSWNFFLSFQKSSTTLQPFELFFETKLINYFHYFTTIYYISVINCQFLGLFTVILSNLNEKLQQSKLFRKLFYLLFVTFSTVVTPPDIISQLCISLCLIISYELLLLIKFININMVTN